MNGVVLEKPDRQVVCCFSLKGSRVSCFSFSCCSQSHGDGGEECLPPCMQGGQPSKGWTGHGIQLAGAAAWRWALVAGSRSQRRKEEGGRGYGRLWRLLQGLRGCWAEGRMGRQEDAVGGLCSLRAWAIQGVFLGYLGVLSFLPGIPRVQSCC